MDGGGARPDGQTTGDRTVAEAPLTWRPGWLILLFVLVAIPGWFNAARDSPGLLRAPLLLATIGYIGWYVVFVANGKRWRVTFDGEVVDVRGRFGHWRFRPEDVGSVIVPTAAPTCALRLDRVERSTLGVRLPWPWPWRRPVTPYVRPEWFVQVVGVPASRVRPGGLRWLASRLLHRPLTPYG